MSTVLIYPQQQQDSKHSAKSLSHALLCVASRVASQEPLTLYQYLSRFSNDKRGRNRHAVRCYTLVIIDYQSQIVKKIMVARRRHLKVKK